MQLIGHQALRIQLQAFFLLAVPQGINQDVFVGRAGKNVNPINYSKGEIVQVAGIDTVFKTHMVLDIGFSGSLLLVLG